jgi:hypothetical protein
LDVSGQCYEASKWGCSPLLGEDRKLSLRFQSIDDENTSMGQEETWSWLYHYNDVEIEIFPSAFLMCHHRILLLRHQILAHQPLVIFIIYEEASKPPQHNNTMKIASVEDEKMAAPSEDVLEVQEA